MVPVSELIALGSLLTDKPLAGTRWYNGSPACAMGMAEAAAGLGQNRLRPQQLEKLYPWLTKTKFMAPCSCSGLVYEWKKPRIARAIIVHLFDSHVMPEDAWPAELSDEFTTFNVRSELESWTLQQLIQWVKFAEQVQSNENIDNHSVKELNFSQAK